MTNRQSPSPDSHGGFDTDQTASVASTTGKEGGDAQSMGIASRSCGEERWVHHAWRFCVDYRKVNAVTRKDAYLLPRIDDTLDTLSGSAPLTI